jgi:hypothetical protein
MTLDQKRARAFGVLYLITFVTSIPALLLYQPVLDDPVGYIAGAGHDKQIFFDRRCGWPPAGHSRHGTQSEAAVASVESAQRSVTELLLGVASGAGVAVLPASVAKRPAMGGAQCKTDRGAGAELRRRPHLSLPGNPSAPLAPLARLMREPVSGPRRLAAVA